MVTLRAIWTIHARGGMWGDPSHMHLQSLSPRLAQGKGRLRPVNACRGPTPYMRSVCAGAVRSRWTIITVASRGSVCTVKPSRRAKASMRSFSANTKPSMRLSPRAPPLDECAHQPAGEASALASCPRR